MTTKRELAAQLRDAGLGRHAATIVARAQPSIRVAAKRCRQDAIALGASRMGGLPDLPASFEWPRFRRRPLAFLAQIELRALSGPGRGQLPPSGWLVLFYEVESQCWGFDPKDRGCAHVVHFDARRKLVRTALPNDMPPAGAFTPSQLTFSSRLDLMETADADFDLGTAVITPPWPGARSRIEQQLSEDELGAYWRLCTERTPATYHHLLGNAQHVQNDMRFECALAASGIATTRVPARTRAAYRARARDWRLLFQIDTDDARDPRWIWGDCGRLYFWIRKQDLAARRFEKTWLVLQCT